MLVEFHRITGLHMTNTFDISLNEWKVVMKLPPLKNEGSLLLEIRAEYGLNNGLNSNDANDDELLLMLLIISLHLKCQYGKFIISSAEEIPKEPVIICDGADFTDYTYHLSVDGRVILSFGRLYDAIKMYFCSFWIFNLSYPKELDTLLKFMQKQLLNINNDGKMERKLLTFITRVNKVQ